MSHKNRLAGEKSPYLLQHADNPVDWYPWGDEAFEVAKREDKPVFLSVGYSTCHWCHVMEEESFEDEKVAKLMNDTFVNIKVDREERPDVDGVYMTVTQMLTGSGGWPMTVVMTPEREPFFAGTYFPRETRMGRIGMLDLVPRIAKLWKEQRESITGDAKKVVRALQEAGEEDKGAKLDESALEKAVDQMASRYDRQNGGFSTAPKFPTPHNLGFLLRQWKRREEPELLEMVENTLEKMRRGGIYDHVGFGFHRYSTDARWLVPHFEKMLYDQALLALVYTEAFQASGREVFKTTAREIFAYVLRDMTSAEGGFYSAEDADSEGKEGKFYLWTTEQIEKAAGEKDAAFVQRVFNAQEAGNFQDPMTGRSSGENILHLNKTPEQLAKMMDIPLEEFEDRLESVRKKLFEARELRVHPYKDDKILTDWNGLMIAALARGGSVLNDPGLVKAAARAADFILNRMKSPEGGLLHRFRDGHAGIEGHLDDYAFFIFGLIELYEADFEVRWLKEALSLTRKMIEEFANEENGGFYFTSSCGETVLLRRKEVYDGAVPSGNSVAALNLLRLSSMTGDENLWKRADALFDAFSGQVGQIPAMYNQLLQALDFEIGPSFEVVIAGKREEKKTEELIEALRTRFLPRKVVLFRDMGEEPPAIAKVSPFTSRQTAPEGKALAYVCSRQECQKPAGDAGEMVKLMEG